MQSLRVRLIDFGLRKYEGAQDVDWPAGVYAPMTGCPPCIEVPAMRCPLGNESTIEAFIWHLLLVLRECRRVLRDDGTCWVNLGDSYATNIHTGSYGKNADWHGLNAIQGERARDMDSGNLLAIPHRFALAAQADGWTLRNDCVWHKKSAMPESVSGWKWAQCMDGDIECAGCAKCEMNDGLVLRRGSWRHTRAQEFVFQFVKGMGYWSDSEIVKEAQTESSIERANYGWNGRTDDGSNGSRTGSSFKAMANGSDTMKTIPQDGKRNPRSVFSPSPSPYKGAHFATWPKELVRPLILSSVPRRCCPECGQGWAAVVESTPMVIRKSARAQEVGRTQTSGTMLEPARSSTTSYRPTCNCGREDYTQGICLDPFVGSGTTLEVARECGVRAIGLDISHEYLEQQASWRGLQIAKPDFSTMPLFAEVANA